MASVTAEYSLAAALVATPARLNDSATTETDPKRTARFFGILLLAMCLTPSCALVTCAAAPDLAGDSIVRSE